MAFFFLDLLQKPAAQGKMPEEPSSSGCKELLSKNHWVLNLEFIIKAASLLTLVSERNLIAGELKFFNVYEAATSWDNLA